MRGGPRAYRQLARASGAGVDEAQESHKALTIATGKAKQGGISIGAGWPP